MSGTELQERTKVLRVLSLDGGGAKGFYTLGVLREVEGLVGRPLSDHFDLIFGTSTGAIIAALLCLGRSIDDIHTLYRDHVTRVMAKSSPAARSQALAELGTEVFGDAKFDSVKTGIGIVATKWMIERPMIFKADPAQGHGRLGTFVPGFGCTISDAVQASCSAYPFFKRKRVTTAAGDVVELVDGGFCANNPTLYALADAIAALKIARDHIKLLSVGVGVYPKPKYPLYRKQKWLEMLPSVQLLQKVLEINTQSMDQLRAILFRDIATIRVSDTFEQPQMATDLFEHDLKKLNILRQRGAESFANREADIRALII